MTLPSPTESTDYSLGFYARQPIFDSKGVVWAYSLCLRDELNDIVSPEARAGATHNVLTAILGEERSQRLVIRFTAQSLTYELPLMFPSQSMVVEVHEDLASAPQALDALRKLKAKGYLVAVSHFSAKPEANILHGLADVLWVNAHSASDGGLLRMVEACQRHPALPGLVCVENHSVYEQGKALGFRLFQGHYFQQPETIRTRNLSSSQFSRLKLLQAIEQEEPDFKSLAETIRTDVALSYKLFSLLNSANFSFLSPIQSVKQALSLLGWEPLRMWIRLVILTDLTLQGKPSELPRSAAMRGRFLEILAQNRTSPTPESLFLMGLFSLLPAMLDQSMVKILDGLRLPEEIRAALLGQECVGTEWLQLAVAFERTDWAGVQAALPKLSLDPLAVARAYAQAVKWTDMQFCNVLV